MKGRVLTTLFVFVLISIIIALSFDSELAPEVKAVIEQYNTEPTIEDNGSVYLLGWWADTEKSPYAIGLERIMDYESKRANSSPAGLDFHDKYTSVSWLEYVDDESVFPLMCHFLEQACLDEIWSQAAAIDAFVDSKKLVLERLEGLMAYDSYRLFSKPTIGQPQPSLQSGLFSTKLKQLQVISLVAKGDYETASHELARLARLNINIIEKTPDIITKVVALVYQAEVIQVASYLMSKTPHSSVMLWDDFIWKSLSSIIWQ